MSPIRRLRYILSFYNLWHPFKWTEQIYNRLLLVKWLRGLSSVHMKLKKYSLIKRLIFKSTWTNCKNLSFFKRENTQAKIPLLTLLLQVTAPTWAGFYGLKFLSYILLKYIFMLWHVSYCISYVSIQNNTKRNGL